MTIIKVEPNSNGSHANQTVSGTITPPDGWAVFPDTLDRTNFPFGDLTAEEIDGVTTVTKWTPGVVPEPEPSIRTPAEKREEAYNTEAIILWEGEYITVTDAATLWQYYAAEGNEKANALTELISAAKAEIRAKYPDEEVAV